MKNMKPSISIGSFNMNGKDLDKIDALKWLQHSNGSSDLVIISLQECPTAPNVPCSEPLSDSDHDKGNKIPVPCIKVFSSSSESSPDDRIQETIKSSLSPQHILLADIAMGEIPTLSPEGKAKSSTFYGYIRLIIFAKDQTVLDLNSSSCVTNPTPLLIPIFAPAGRKSAAPSGDTYPNHRSPDKGGVCICIPSLEILICSVHLCGTNEYNTPEKIFDEIRFNELDIIAEECQRVLFKKNHSPARTISVDDGSEFAESLTSKYQPIICGDLNFRVEMFSNPADKSRGGRDFKAVHDILEEGNLESVRQLFCSHDHLLQLLLYLDGAEKDGMDKRDEVGMVNNKSFEGLTEKVKDLLRNVRDVFMENHGIQGNVKITFPTFTFDVKSRIYSDKRTPSWTDRILVSKKLFQEGYIIEDCGANFSITSSDHVPVFAVLRVV